MNSGMSPVMATLLLLIHLCAILTGVLWAQEIPGPHYPSDYGVDQPGDEIINTGTVPKFESYIAIDATGQKHTYVPVYTAVQTDAGNSNFKDVRQLSDKTIKIQGSTFYCAIGHPYRQFAFQEKYKWEMKSPKFVICDQTVPAIPLIRMFLVDINVVTDIMKGSTTQKFNKVGGAHDSNVDNTVATNQFEISSESKSKLETAALPGSLVTYVENLNHLDLETKYKEIVKYWGEINDVSHLKARFNVPTDIFPDAKSSIFVTEDVKLATSHDIRKKLNPQDKNYHEVLNYCEALKKMEGQSTMDKFNSQEISIYEISKYPVRDFADTKTVNDLIRKQNINANHFKDAKRLFNSVAIVEKRETIETSLIEILPNSLGKELKNKENELEKAITQGSFFSSTDKDFLKNLKSVLGFLSKKKVQEEFPFGKNGKKLTREELVGYFKDGLTNYIQSKECKLSNDNKNIIVQYINNDKNTKRKIAFTNDKNTKTKIELGVKNPACHIILPGDQLSIQLVGKDVTSEMIKNALSQMPEMTLFVSPKNKLILEFPDIDMDSNNVLSWKKQAVQVGEDSMGIFSDKSMDIISDKSMDIISNIELTFKNSKSLEYNMVSHTIHNGHIKEVPFIFIDGHSVIDNHIGIGKNIINKMEEILGDKFKDLRKSKATDIVFLPRSRGLCLTNKDLENVKKSVTTDEYKAKQIKQPISNEIIIRLETPNEANTGNKQNKERELAVTEEVSNRLVSGYRKKEGRVNIVPISASKEGDKWMVDTQSVDNIGTFDNVRITIVGVQQTSPQTGSSIIDLVDEIIAKLKINDHDLKRISLVACNPETTEIKFNDAQAQAQKMAKLYKASVSFRMGYIKVDTDGHKWYSNSPEKDYHRRQEGDVYIAEYIGDTVPLVIKKFRSHMYDIEDSSGDLSGHLGPSKTVSNEHDSATFKKGWDIQQEIARDFENDKVDIKSKLTADKTGLNNPKLQKLFQKAGNSISKYGMLQTALYLLKADKCENTAYSSQAACEAKKTIEITSLSQEILEIVSDAAKTVYKHVKSMRETLISTPKIGAVGKNGLKLFGKSAMRNGLKSLPVLGFGLDIASLGLDIYDLTRAKTDTEKGIQGTNVALSSLSVITGGTALVAGLMGATAISVVAGPAAIVVGIIAFLFNIGVSIWQQLEFAKKQREYENIQKTDVGSAVGWFEEKRSLYKTSWYNCNEATLDFKHGVEVKSVDIANRYMTINSAYLCETKMKDWKYHFRILPFVGRGEWCDDYTELESNCDCRDIDCPELINVRYGMNFNDRQNVNCNGLKTVVLNTAPVVLYNYSYAYFDKYDPLIGTYLGRMIGDKYHHKFYYDYRFCFKKYAIIKSPIGVKRYIPSVTELKLGNDHITIMIPEYKEDQGVSLNLLGVYGAAYSVYLNNTCKVQLQSRPGHLPLTSNITVWQLFIDTELVDLLCTFKSNTHLVCEYKSTELQVVTVNINQVIFIDKNNIVSVPMYTNKTKLYILEFQATRFTSDKEVLAVMNRYLGHDDIDLASTYVPIKNVTIQVCGNKVISKVLVSKAFVSATLHFTSEYPGSCSTSFNTDAELQLVKNGLIYYSSSLKSLVWKTHYSNNSLDTYAMLPCHSHLRSDIVISDRDGTIYITQKLNTTTTEDITIIYKLTDFRLFLLSISSDFDVPWERLKPVCFDSRKSIFNDQNSIVLNTRMLTAGENDLTLVNTSNDVYWVRKLNKQIAGIIFPNINTACDAIDIVIPDNIEHISTEHDCTERRNGTSTKNDMYYFLCMNGSESYTFVQFDNNQAKRIENLNYQDIYFDGNDIFVKNKSNTFTVDEASPTKVCLYENEMNLPYEHEESIEDLMVQISQQYECIESKVKLKFKHLVGWFDFEEMVAVILHKSINSYKLKAIGPTPDVNKYWIWDTVNGSLYLQETAGSAEMLRLINGNITEEEYQAKISIPKKIMSNVEEVSYKTGRVYVYASTGATYYIKENGDSEILAVTDYWFESHPLTELKKETNKEFVMYRPDKQNKPSDTNRCKRSTSMDQNQTDHFLLYHISFGIFFNVDLEESVFIGSNRNNMSVLIYNHQSGSMLEVDEKGTFLSEDKYDIFHRINDKTVILQTNNDTESAEPPIIDNIYTIILSSSHPGFTFNITQEYWSQINEILISDDTEPLSVYLDMLPCVYELEHIDDRFLLIDYAFRRKLVIPNVEERSKENQIIFFVCGERIKLHDTNEDWVLIIGTSISVVVFDIVLVIFVMRRRRSIYKAVKTNVEAVPGEVEMQDVQTPTVQTEQSERAVQTSVVAELNAEKQQGEFYGSKETKQKYSPLIVDNKAAPSTSEQTDHKEDVFNNIKNKPVFLTTGLAWHN